MQRPTVIIWLALIVSVAGLAGWAGNDESATSDLVGGLAFLDEVDVTVVNIEVFVRDKDGSPVTDLGIGDFRVFQDGERREITNFLLVNETVRRTFTEAPPAAEASPWRGPTPAGRKTIRRPGPAVRRS